MKKMRKLTVSVIVNILVVILTKVSFVWACIEFILYLVKDKVFNWAPVWLFSVSILTAIGLLVYSIIENVINNSKAKKEQPSKPKTSRFQERLNKAMEEAKQAK